MAKWEQHIVEMDNLWLSMRIIRDDHELSTTANKIKQFQAVYEKVQAATGVPWQMVAVIHIREAGVQDVGRWKCCLHNGEAIIGTGRRTSLVPAGLGPFATWHEAAVNALSREGLIGRATWTPGAILAALEPYNGYGYRQHGLRSPYIWASTNHQQPGKYVRDGVFAPDVMDTQVGCAAQLRYLGVTVPEVTTRPLPSKTTTTAVIVAGGGAVAATKSMGMGWAEAVAIGLAVAIVVVAVFEVVKRWKNK